MYTISKEPSGEFTLIVINRRFVRGHIAGSGDNLFLKLVLQDWEWLHLKKNDEVPVVTDRFEGTVRIVTATCCPGGEPEAWVVLKPVGPLPKHHPPAVEVRASAVARFPTYVPLTD
jgi:hypothetical protein